MKRRLILLLISFLSIGLWLPVQAEEEPFLFSFVTLDQREVEEPIQEEHHSISQTVWKNETAYFKIAIFSPQETTISIQVLGLEEMEVEATFLEEVNASLGIGKNTTHKMIPDLISHETTKEILPNKTSFIWVRVQVPQGIEPGGYLGRILLQDSFGNQRTAYLRLQVSKWSLGNNNLSINLWQYPYHSLQYYDCLKGHEAFDSSHLEVLKKEMELYKELGGRSITTTIVNEAWAHQTYYDTPSMVKWHYLGDNQYYFTYEDFDKWVSLCMELGIDQRIDVFTILLWNHAILVEKQDGSQENLFLTPGSYSWKAAWQSFLYSFMDHLMEKGWFEKTYFWMDEREPESVLLALDLVEEVVNDKGESFHLGLAVNDITTIPERYQEIDELSVSIATLPNDLETIQSFVQKRKDENLKTTLYNCTNTFPSAFAYSNPYESVWTMLYAYYGSMDGFLRWAYNAYNENPYESLDDVNFESGDAFLIYPDQKDEKHPNAYRSVRLDMMQYGLQVVQKWELLLNNYPELISESYVLRMEGYINKEGAMVVSEENDQKTQKEVLRILELEETYSPKEPWMDRFLREKRK